jgi:hypothetical protein
MKEKVKEYFITKLQIASFILSLVGWFLLFIFIFGRFFEQQLLALENIVESKVFIWGLRIFIILLVVSLLKAKKFVQKAKENKRIRIILKIILIGGAIGWLWWFVTAMIQFF